MDRDIIYVLDLGEGEGIEFKSEYTNKVGRTICSFANTSRFDEDFCNEFNYPKHFDHEKLKSMLKHNNSDIEEHADKVIVNLGVGIKRNGHVAFRNAGVLFFAKDLNAFYPHASIRCFRFRGTRVC